MQTLEKVHTVVLLGNSNSGKSSLFNHLTGLHQKVSNFPGATVEKKSGILQLPSMGKTRLIDFPGTYSLHPNSYDEQIVTANLINASGETYPDFIIYVADINQLEKHLLLFSQIRDLNIPTVLVLNMSDIAQRNGLECNIQQLEKSLGVPVIEMSAKSGAGVSQLKQNIDDWIGHKQEIKPSEIAYRFSEQEKSIIEHIRPFLPAALNDYQVLLHAQHTDWLPHISGNDKEKIKGVLDNHYQFDKLDSQVRETMQRFNTFVPIVKKSITKPGSNPHEWTDKLDSILTHKVWGMGIFLVLMLFIFQAIFTWASIPMDLIDGTFSHLGEWVKSIFPITWLGNLISDGILAGLGGILIFVPQIAILFFLITLLEEAGYMSRVVYLFDNILRRFGLNGKSIVALVSGSACAIPAIMSTRTIVNPKERLITTLVTPFISCQARIPVYAVLIGFVVAPHLKWGPFHLQGLAFMGLYLLGIFAAVFAAYIFKKVLKVKGSNESYLLLELPDYHLPSIKNVLITVWDKVKIFVWEAGRIIFVFSIILWFLASFGPVKKMQQAEGSSYSNS